MAELHHLPGAADARPDPEPLPAVPVQGWDCETMNDPAYCAVIVNPAAPFWRRTISYTRCGRKRARWAPYRK